MHTQKKLIYNNLKKCQTTSLRLFKNFFCVRLSLWNTHIWSIYSNLKWQMNKRGKETNLLMLCMNKNTMYESCYLSFRLVLPEYFSQNIFFKTSISLVYRQFEKIRCDKIDNFFWHSLLCHQISFSALILMLY